MVNGIRRAYFHAPAKRSLFIELPAEDKDAKPGEVGRLNVCLYGTRDAAKQWQEALSKHLSDLGFTRGKGHPAVFAHPSRGIMTLVHGDDYVSAGLTTDLDWLEEELGKKYGIKTQRAGQHGDAECEVKVLNRVIRRTENGYEMEADPRHSELICEQLLESGVRKVTTPGTDANLTKEDEEPLTGDAIRQFRSTAARCNYLGLDRPDLQFAIKEVCREMSNPTQGSHKRLQRIGQYLDSHKRVVWSFEWQDPVSVLDVYGDANWAACRRTRKSTSGGCILQGAVTV